MGFPVRLFAFHAAATLAVAVEWTYSAFFKGCVSAVSFSLYRARATRLILLCACPNHSKGQYSQLVLHFSQTTPYAVPLSLSLRTVLFFRGFDSLALLTATSALQFQFLFVQPNLSNDNNAHASCRV